MTIDKANKVISEYMGHNILCCYDRSLGFYHQSLDSLISVWKKLNVLSIEGFLDLNNFEVVFSDGSFSESHQHKTIQEAACIATAKAIEGLKNEY